MIDIPYLDGIRTHQSRVKTVISPRLYLQATTAGSYFLLFPQDLLHVIVFAISGTFKLRKFNLQKEGFDPRTITDKLFFLHPKTG